MKQENQRKKPVQKWSPLGLHGQGVSPVDEFISEMNVDETSRELGGKTAVKNYGK